MNDTPEGNRETAADREKRVLAFWDEREMFKKSERGIRSTSYITTLRERFFGKKEFFFYDGPPFATGLPHYGHILASAVKDAIPRYRTMRGEVVQRKWGWDCHGLPLEVEIEKEIGTKTKKDIEQYGIEKFNAKAREAIFRYAEEWKKIIPRIGRWVDMENDYRTVNTSYTESVWNVFCRLHKKGFVSEGHKSLHLCPRCSTTLSNNEVTEGYAEVEDIAVYVLFPSKEQENTYFVAWTTTPWTLLGNVALALHKDLQYAVVERNGKRYIVHEDMTDLIEGGTVIEKRKGATFVGTAYETIFPMLYRDDPKEVMGKLWRMHHADYVDASVGTGIVHLAPAYGAEDMELAQNAGLPIRHHVTKDGAFVEKLGAPFKGLRPKEKGNPKDVDMLLLETMREKGRLLHSETITHSYPLCWRCATPLLNYATNSWFINVEKYKDKMVRANKKVNWIPTHLRDGRFGNWLEQSRAWAVSRSRFWGAPLPVWKVKKTGENILVSSIEEMMQKMKPRNEYLLVRHAQSESNLVKNISAHLSTPDALTDVGVRQATELAEQLRKLGPTVIIASPLQRTKETAEIVADALGLSIEIEPGLIELQVSGYEGKKWSEVSRVYEKPEIPDPHTSVTIVGETFFEFFGRLHETMQKINQKYEGENILIVSHLSVILALQSLQPYLNKSMQGYIERKMKIPPLKNASITPWTYLHLNRDNQLDVDLHRPYIDDVVLYDEAGNEAEHIHEVFDCWFESGSMPYGSHHYPFKNLNIFDPERKRGFPANFICEGLDQTRGWFYSLMAIGVGAFNMSPYKQVITTGLIRAADGKKMSKSLKNYTDPMEIVEKYGADSLRHYLLGSAVTRGQDLDFQDTSVDEIYRKVYGRLHNCLLFYKTYALLPHSATVEQPLDNYIRSRLEQVRREMTENFDSYQLDRAVQPIGEFVEDLSAWYVRRSRDTLRADTLKGAQARETLRFVLTEFSKCIAPIAPFYAEHMYQELRELSETTLPESVHLCEWPESQTIDKRVLEEMDTIRKIVSVAHEQRSTANIKVRQPLARVYVNATLSDSAKEILADEINVKEVVVDVSRNEVAQIDTELTDALREEGFIREVVRVIQSERKKQNCSLLEILPRISLSMPQESQDVLQKYKRKLETDVQTEQIELTDKISEGTAVYTVAGIAVSIVLHRSTQ